MQPEKAYTLFFSARCASFVWCMFQAKIPLAPICRKPVTRSLQRHDSFTTKDVHEAELTPLKRSFHHRGGLLSNSGSLDAPREAQRAMLLYRVLFPEKLVPHKFLGETIGPSSTARTSRKPVSRLPLLK